MSKVKINVKSKTHWLGMVMGILGSVVTFLPAAREFIPDDVYGGLFIGFSIAVIVLRNVTTEPIDEK